jgi:serine/threonine-protein phosphatase 2A regulatory subunit A
MPTMSSTLSSHPTLTPNLNTTLRPNSTPSPSISLARSLANLNYDTLLSIDPFKLFLAQLDTPSAETRVDAMRRCFVVANAIGREATLNQLIPFLANHVNKRGELAAEKSHAAAVPTGSEEDDEILLILAEQLGQLVISGLVPGYRALSILPILEKLAGVEETVVRDKAVESMNSVIPRLVVDGQSVKGKEEEEARQTCVRSAPGLLLAMVKRMAGADWFTAKISSCSVLPCVYQFYNSMKNNDIVSTSDNGMGLEDGGGVTVRDIKLELRNMYRSLAEDDTPMVRRGAGKNLGRYAEAVATLPYGKKGGNSGPVAKEFIIPGGKDEATIKKTVSSESTNSILEDVVPVYQVLASDEQDSVRLLAVSNSGSIGCALGLDGNLTSRVVLPIIKAHSADLSW